MNIDDMQKNAAQAANLLKAIAHPERLMILCQLVNGEYSAGDLAKASALSQSAFSQHLAVLRQHRFVNTRKEAQVVYYRLQDPAVIKILNVLHGIYCGI